MTVIKDLHHINIRTPDLAATKRLFVDALGLSEGWRPGISGRPGAWLYVGEKPIVHITEVDEEPGESTGRSLDHIAFEVADYEATLARVEQSEIPFKVFGNERTARRQILLRDASGASIELQWVNPAPTE